MTAARVADWRKDFGIAERRPPQFLSSVDQLDQPGGAVPQPLALRRAFEQIGIDGVLCQQRVDPDEGLQPVIYFRQVSKIQPEEVTEIHRSFWNQGIAPVLVVIRPRKFTSTPGLFRLHPVRPARGGSRLRRNTRPH